MRECIHTMLIHIASIRRAIITWIILQMCFVLEIHHVRTLDDFLRLQTNKSVRLCAFAISKKQILNAIGVRARSCRAPLHKEYPKHHGHKGDPRVTPGTCGTVGERAQGILVWMRAQVLRTSLIYGD